MKNKNFVWFFGVVENIQDPKQIGRVQVRCYGYHSHKEEQIPSQNLPWATVMAPTTNSSFRGVDTTVHGLAVGSSVFGFFLDGEDAQYPMIMGSVPGQAPKKSPNVQNSYAHINSTMNFLADEADVGTMAQNGPPTTPAGKSYVANLNAAGTTNVNTATPPKLSAVDGVGFSDSYYDVPKWSLPPPRGGSDTSSYMYNKFTMTKSGHVMEVDDTPDNERIMTYHKSGTYQEYDANGHLVTRVVGNNYEVIIGDDNIVIKGNANLTVEGNMRQLVLGNYNLEVVGDYTEKIHGTKKVKITGNDLKEIVGYESSLIGADQKVAVTGEIRTSSGNGWKQYIAGDYDITIGGLVPTYSVTTSGLTGLIQLNAGGIGGVVDIIGGLSASIKGESTIVGDPTTTLGKVTITGKVIDTISLATLTQSAIGGMSITSGTDIAVAAAKSAWFVGAINATASGGGSTVALTGAAASVVAPLINLN